MSTITEALQAGLDYHRAGRLRDAEEMYRKVLEMYPRHATAVHLLGLLAYQVGKDQEAVEYIGAAMQLDRFNARFPADLAEIYRAMGKTSEAMAACEKAIELNPELPGALTCLGQLHQSQGNVDEAIRRYREALELDANSAPAHAGLGTALRTAGQLPAAQAECERAVQLAPDNADHYLGLGVCLYDQGKLQDAIACYQKALRLKPDLVKAQYNCALARLALGDYASGWNEFETRHSFPSLVRRRYPMPMWNPAEPSAGPVLVHAEQGLGDVLQFIRFVPLVAERAPAVFVDVQEELIPLLTQSGFQNLVTDGAQAPQCQRQIPMLSLPRLLGVKADSIPGKVPYLSARDDLVEHWRAKLAGVRGFKVGINWQGSPGYYNDRARSIPLRHFAALARTAGVQLVSLQKKGGTEQIAEVAGSFTVHDFGNELDEAHGAFVDSAAVIRNLDLVITSDTSIAHLAGALGAPVWVALSFAPDWRWMQRRGDSPWYPTMRLFRQSQLDDWEDVFAEMAAELARLSAR